MNNFESKWNEMSAKLTADFSRMETIHADFDKSFSATEKRIAEAGERMKIKHAEFDKSFAATEKRIAENNASIDFSIAYSALESTASAVMKHSPELGMGAALAGLELVRKNQVSAPVDVAVNMLTGLAATLAMKGFLKQETFDTLCKNQDELKSRLESNMVAEIYGGYLQLLELEKLHA